LGSGKTCQDRKGGDLSAFDEGEPDSVKNQEKGKMKGHNVPQEVIT
jgi:hypothetical protein